MNTCLNAVAFVLRPHTDDFTNVQPQMRNAELNTMTDTLRRREVSFLPSQNADLMSARQSRTDFALHAAVAPLTFVDAFVFCTSF
jgi:hypothetical protein